MVVQPDLHTHAGCELLQDCLCESNTRIQFSHASLVEHSETMQGTVKVGSVSNFVESHIPGEVTTPVLEGLCCVPHLGMLRQITTSLVPRLQANIYLKLFLMSDSSSLS